MKIEPSTSYATTIATTNTAPIWIRLLYATLSVAIAKGIVIYFSISLRRINKANNRLTNKRCLRMVENLLRAAASCATLFAVSPI